MSERVRVRVGADEAEPVRADEAELYTDGCESCVSGVS